MCTEVLYKYLLYEIFVVSLGYSFQGPGCTPVGGPCVNLLYANWYWVMSGWYWVMSGWYRYQHIPPMSLQVAGSTWWLFKFSLSGFHSIFRIYLLLYVCGHGKLREATGKLRGSCVEHAQGRIFTAARLIWGGLGIFWD